MNSQQPPDRTRNMRALAYRSVPHSAFLSLQRNLLGAGRRLYAGLANATNKDASVGALPDRGPARGGDSWRELERTTTAYYASTLSVAGRASRWSPCASPSRRTSAGVIVRPYTRWLPPQPPSRSGRQGQRAQALQPRKTCGPLEAK